VAHRCQLGEWRDEVVSRSRYFIETWARDHGLRPADVINAGLLDEFASVQARLDEQDRRIAELEGDEASITPKLVRERGEEADAASEAIADDLQVRQIAATDELEAGAQGATKRGRRKTGSDGAPPMDSVTPPRSI
jgi:hypothetical protein